MSPRDIALAVSVAVVWGLTFIAIKVGVGETSPLMLSALRFLFAAIPFILFVKPPKSRASTVALYGLLIGVGQFGVLFIAIHQGFPVGLASLVVQAQAFFTIALAWIFMGKRPRSVQLLGAGIALAGMAVIGSARLAGASFGPFLPVILASFFWAAGNVAAKTAGKVDMLAFTVWSSLAPPLPLILLSLAVDGPGSFGNLSSACWLSPTPGRCSATGSGRGCFHIIRRRRSHPSRCWRRSSAWSRVRSYSASRCARLSLPALFW